LVPQPRDHPGAVGVDDLAGVAHALEMQVDRLTGGAVAEAQGDRTDIADQHPLRLRLDRPGSGRDDVVICTADRQGPAPRTDSATNWSMDAGPGVEKCIHRPVARPQPARSTSRPRASTGTGSP